MITAYNASVQYDYTNGQSAPFLGQQTVGTTATAHNNFASDTIGAQNRKNIATNQTVEQIASH